MSNNQELIEYLYTITSTITNKDTEQKIKQFNYLNSKELKKIKTELFTVSIILLRNTKEFYAINDVYSQIIEFYNLKQAYYISNDFFIDKNLLE
jgi:hypothetical protein